MKKIFYSSIFVVLNVAFLDVEAMRSKSSGTAKMQDKKRLSGPRLNFQPIHHNVRMICKACIPFLTQNPSSDVVQNSAGNVLRNDSHHNGVCRKKLRGIPQPDLSRFMDEKQQLPVEPAQHNIQHIYAEDCESPDQMVIRAVGVGRRNAIAQNQVIHLGVINLTTFLEILRDLGRMYAISAEKILADCSGVEKDVFDEIFGCGMYETNYVRDPERFLDCILSGDELELSAQEDLRQKLIKLGWSDDSAKNCKVVLNWPDDLHYEYKSANPRLEKVIQCGL